MSTLKHIEQKDLPYTAEQMYALVADVARYKEFVPWCIASRINKRDGDDTFYADLVIGYKLIRERFSSKVMLEENKQITIEYLKGPLQHLQNHWRFIPDPDGGCTIDFNVEFEFKNKALQGLAQVFFQEVVKRMTNAFEARAEEVYGKVP